MILDFDLDLFKHRLAETVAWCVPRFSLDDPKMSLRTPPNARDGIDDVFAGMDSEMMQFADSVFAKRANALSVDMVENVQEGLAGGRLVLLYMSDTLCDGIGPIYSKGFIDECNFPAWDTWLYYGLESQRSHRRYGTIRDTKYLISWVPEQVIPLMNDTIEILAEQCLQWVENDHYNLSFIDLLRS